MSLPCSARFQRFSRAMILPSSSLNCAFSCASAIQPQAITNTISTDHFRMGTPPFGKNDVKEILTVHCPEGRSNAHRSHQKVNKRIGRMGYFLQACSWEAESLIARGALG